MNYLKAVFLIASASLIVVASIGEDFKINDRAVSSLASSKYKSWLSAATYSNNRSINALAQNTEKTYPSLYQCTTNKGLTFTSSIMRFCNNAESRKLKEDLQDLLRAYPRVPAVGAATIANGKLQKASVVGLRKMGHDVEVSMTDSFHIGSMDEVYDGHSDW